jgi:predicted dehydrogenase
MAGVALIGAGFVADLYLRGLRGFPAIPVLGVFDRDPAAAARLARHWGLRVFSDLDALLDALPPAGLALNLTNPASHAEVTRACLGAARHVWSEKPLTLSLPEARELAALAGAQRVTLSSAPSSVLSESVQTFLRAVRDGRAGTPRLAYAELDDGFIPLAPHAAWRSESGAPWPWEDEARTGCTLEHAGYWLAPLVAAFGPLAEIEAATATVYPDKGIAGAAPDFSVGLLRFAGGMTARLTCSIAAPHDHSLTVVGDRGTLRLAEAWDNDAPVRLHPRLRLRRRLVDSPFGRRLRLRGPTHPKVRRRGAAAMNFALGPAEALEAIARGRPPRLSGDWALHLLEATLALQAGGRHVMTTRCTPPEPMPWAA